MTLVHVTLEGPQLHPFSRPFAADSWIPVIRRQGLWPGALPCALLRLLLFSHGVPRQAAGLGDSRELRPRTLSACSDGAHSEPQSTACSPMGQLRALLNVPDSCVSSHSQDKDKYCSHPPGARHRVGPRWVLSCIILIPAWWCLIAQSQEGPM